MESTIRILLTVIVGYSLGVGAVYVFQRALMYFPDTSLPSRALAGTIDMTEVTLSTADGLELLAWYKPAERPGAATIVYFHGNAGSIEHRGFKVRPFLGAGHGVLLVEYRGYGGNPGKPTEDGLYRDGRAAMDFVAAQGVAARSIVLYGESLGSGVAVQMATERGAGAMVLEAPFTSAADVGAAAYPFLPVRLLIKDRFDSLDKIPAIAAPLFILHGEADRIVPVRMGKALFAAANEPKEARFVPDATHNDVYDRGGGKGALDFLNRYFGD